MFFEKIISIELADELYEKAKIRFKYDKNVFILHGNSSEVLPKVIAQLGKKSIFWLDGHYSGGITAKGEKCTPVEDEIKTIFNHKIKDYVILIDDARLFNGNDDYPTIEKLKEEVLKIGNYDIKVESNIIRITKL